MKEHLVKYKQFLLYAVFGVLTTLVNMVAYWVFAYPCGIPTVPSTVLAWVAAVAFAYFTNRLWVFESKAKGAKEILKEAAAFFGCRLATGVLDWAWMFLFVDCLHVNDMLMKLTANVIVIILNFIASKLLIFKK